MIKNKTITKEILTGELQNKLGLSELLCEEIVNVVFEELIHHATSTSKLTIKNFGRFSLNKKQNRPGQNVITGKAVEVSARTVLSFVAARTFKERLQV